VPRYKQGLLPQKELCYERQRLTKGDYRPVHDVVITGEHAKADREILAILDPH